MSIKHFDDFLEKTVIGELLLIPKQLEEISEFFRGEFFHNKAYRTIYEEGILPLYTDNKEVDIVTVSAELLRRGKIKEIGGHFKIAELSDVGGTQENIVVHAKLLQELWMKRQIVSKHREVERKLVSGDDVFEVIEDIEKFQLNLQGNFQGSEVVSMKEIVLQHGRKLSKLMSSENNGITGLKTGIRAIDIPMSGLQPDLIYVAGRPGSGKSSLVMNLARKMAVEQQIPVGVFSIEMSKEALINRMVSTHCMIDMYNLKTGKLTEQEFKNYHGSIDRLLKAPIYIDDTGAIPIMELRSKARKMVTKYGVKAIFIDYVQLITTSNNEVNATQNKHAQLSYVSKQLLAMKKELNIPIVPLSQLSRSVETRGGEKRPIISDMRESGSLEEDADIVLLLYRPSYYKIEPMGQDGMPRGKHYMELDYGKFRDGSTGPRELSFVGQYNLVDDYNEFYDKYDQDFSSPAPIKKEYQTDWDQMK